MYEYNKTFCALSTENSEYLQHVIYHMQHLSALKRVLNNIWFDCILLPTGISIGTLSSNSVYLLDVRKMKHDALISPLKLVNMTVPVH